MLYESLRSGFGSSYACGNRNCRHHEGLTERETWLWLPRAPFTRQLIALYEWICEHQPSVAATAYKAEMDEHAIASLFERFHCGLCDGPCLSV